MAAITQSEASTRNSIKFLLNGRQVTVNDVHPALSVLDYLREYKHLTGTKEGCAEGDCGACTVVVGELDGQRLLLKTVNACIRFLPTLDGKALFTVEYLRQSDGALHPVQQAMVDSHGSQCGFCTPGFVMSLWQVYNDHTVAGSRPDQAQVRTALTGNLCRCTGYRPILEAGDRMFDLPQVRFDTPKIHRQLTELQCEQALDYRCHSVSFLAPRSLSELTSQTKRLPNATVMAGCTDIGLWVNKQFRDLGDIVYIGEVAELKKVATSEQHITIGSAVSLTQAYSQLIQYYPEAAEIWERFASVPIRNAGTLGGNIVNGSPIGDSMPWLIAVGARVILTSVTTTRSLPLQDFYLGYMQNALADGEILKAIEIPLPAADLQFRTYKLSKRFDSDISAVCAAFAIRQQTGLITAATIAFGGMAAVPRRAGKCEQALIGQPWNEKTLHAGQLALANDFQPLSDLRASSANRVQSAGNLLKRFYLETRPVDPLPAAALSVFSGGVTSE